jgi:hypothetical protein
MKLIITSISVVMRAASQDKAPLTYDYASRTECDPVEIPDKLHNWLVDDKTVAADKAHKSYEGREQRRLELVKIECIEARR